MHIFCAVLFNQLVAFRVLLFVFFVSQVTNPVQFEQSLANVMGKGFEYGYECGPGKVVAGILKRVDKKAQMTNIQV